MMSGIFSFSYPVFFAMMEVFRQLLCEPYPDADPHDVLLHLPSQIPDRTPYTYSFLVLLLLPPYVNIYREHAIYTLDNNILLPIE
jgi:hypothetical protein